MSRTQLMIAGCLSWVGYQSCPNQLECMHE